MATQNANLDAWFIDAVTGPAGNGQGDRMSVGFTTVKHRFAMRFARPTEWATISDEDQLLTFKVKMRTSNDNGGIGSAVKFRLERGTTTFSENSVSGRSVYSDVGPANSEWPGPTRVTPADPLDQMYEGTPADGDWITVDALDLGKQWFTAGWTELILVAVAVNAAGALDESNVNRHVTIRTRESASKPYVEFTLQSNQAPLVATDLEPAVDATFGSTDGLHLTMTGRYTDPDGDPADKMYSEIYPESSTDGSLGTPYTTGAAGATGIALVQSGQLKSIGSFISGVTPPIYVKWRIRFRDINGLYGPWTSLRRVQLAYDVLSPQQPTVTPGTLDPDFFASLISSDPNDYITAGQVWVYEDPAQGQTITKWDSGKTAVGGTSNRLQLSYGGSSLEWGKQYRWRVQLWNQSDVASPQSGDLYFTQTEPTGPNIVPGDLNTKQNTLTPTFTLTDPAGGAITTHRMRFYSPSGILLSDTGVVSSASSLFKNVTAPAGIWDWGQEPLVDAAIGNPTLGPFSELKRIHLNAKPGSPYPLTIVTTGAVQRSDGIWVVDAAQPTLSIPFRDTDKDLGYTEAPSRREIEIRTLADAHFASSPYIQLSGIVNNYQIPSALTAENTYKVRSRYDDNAGVRSEWSDYLFVKRSAAPTLSSVTPANAATVTDPTPTFAWTFNSAGGKAQAFYRLQAVVSGDEVYDSGLVEGATGSITMAAFVLPNSSTVSWTLQVWDTDGLSVTLTRTFTTNFTQPAAITGLTVTPDEEAKALLVSWTQSLLATNEFEAYYVEARTSNTQWQRVATITDKTTTTYSYYGAPHNTDVTVRVIQTNGWMDSNPTEAVGELVVNGYWWLRPEALELRYVRIGDFSASPTTITEEFEPRGASNFVVLTWESYGVRWEMQMLQPPDDRSVIEALWADMRSGRVGILKTPDGHVYYSKLRSVPFTHREVGHYGVPLSGTEVSYLEADF